MEEEDEDDIYAPEDSIAPGQDLRPGNGTTTNASVNKAGNEEDEEEGEEVEEDESDSDIDIITERKGDQKPESVQPPRVNALKTAPVRPPSTDPAATQGRSPGIKTELPGKETPTRSGASYPEVKTSSLDVDAKPIYEPNGKPITDIDMDADFPEDDRPWRRPGTDMTDYFNYGFDEFTWASYCLKQSTLRKEVTDSKKQMEDMQSFLSMPGGMPAMPGIPGAPAGAQTGMPAMGGPGDMPPEMQQMFTQMMSQGIDPTQMDPAAFMQMMQGGQGAASGDPSQGFSGGQGFGQQGQNQQQMGYGFGAGGGAGGAGGRNQGGRGQNRRW
ncbi:cleavage polyadenylation factor subunit fip1 [Mycoblastus sanguinarius]|nr:cleavage polyadenylation factor subunit fip1 [Mycoblastus sanguinarius]